MASSQPGAWLSPDGIPVDLMVPESLAGPSGRRGARIPPHSTSIAFWLRRRSEGLPAPLAGPAWPLSVLAGTDDEVQLPQPLIQRPKGLGALAQSNASICPVPPP